MISDLPILVLGPKYGAWVAAKVAFPYSTCKWLTSTSQNSNKISDAEKGTSCKKSTEQRHARGYMVCRDEPLCFFSLSERGWKRDGGCGCRIRMGRQGWCCPPQLFPAPAFWCHPLLGQVDSLYVSIWCLALSLPTLKKSQFWQKLELQVVKEPITSEWNSLLKKAPTIFSAMIWAFAIHWTSCVTIRSDFTLLCRYIRLPRFYFPLFPHTEAHVWCNLVVLSCMIWSSGFSWSLLYDIYLRAMHTTILSIRGVTCCAA